MILKRLHLRNFRNYHQCDIFFGPKINFFCGGNAQGKTNLLEAIYLLSYGRSFRSASLEDLIQKGKDYFFLQAILEKDHIQQSLSFYFDGKNKKIQLGQKPLQTFSALFGIMPSVLYAPSDIYLLSGFPLQRRRFLNLHLAQHDPLYVYHLARYWKALRQRNNLLKKGIIQTLSSWDEEITKSGLYLIKKRNHMLNELSSYLSSFISILSKKEEKIEISYQASIPKNFQTLDKYPEYLQKNRSRELQCGTTLFGPHRDDWNLFINGFNAKSSASEGQKKTFLLALKFAEWQRLKNICAQNILLSLDDLSSHLDLQRQTALRQMLSLFDQVFITTPKISLQKENLLSLSLFHIKKGSICPYS